MYSQVPDQFIIKIVGSQSGSGILYFPQAHPDIVLVFTAWHCIKDTPLSGLRLTLGNQTSYQCTDDGNHHILSFEEKEGENDLAILVIPRGVIPMDEPTQQFEFLNDFFDLKDGWAVGFPNANDGLKKLRGEFRQMKDGTPNRFEVSTQKEDLTTLYSDGLENVKGMSGGGFFMESSGATYLAGILTKFSKEYKDFVCIKVGKLNELLVANGYHPLPYSFANSLGMNAQWFDRHIQMSIEDLGDRYTQEIPNFDVPIAQYFDGLSRGKVFHERVKGYFHEFLKIVQKDGDLRKPEDLNIAAYFKDRHTWFSKFYEEANWFAPTELLLDKLFDSLSIMDKEANGFLNKILQLQYQAKESLPLENRHYASTPFDWEAHHLRQIINAIDDFQRNLQGGTMQLAQTPYLLLHGKAGYGKSHLLGDIATQKRKDERPAILVLGNKLRGGQNAWCQILDELGLACDAETFLKTLNAIGHHIGERVLFMIDALNEGSGKEFWKDCLAGFIHKVNKYPFIGLVLAVRDTYLDIVVPETLTKNKSIIKIAHNGFGGNELNAVKYFCRFFQLEQPRFPILSPEFSNPQLLLLLCRSLRDSGKNSFPEGLNGITAIYENYLDTVNCKISTALDCPPRLKLVQNALKHLAETIAEEGTGAIELLSAERIFNQFHPKYGSELFRELTREGTLHEDREWKHEKQAYEDVVRFNYERFGDFIAAQYLLEKHINTKKPKAAFQGKGFFISYFSEKYHNKLGILETLAVVLPEKYEVELLEAFSSRFLKDEQFGRYAASAFVHSLLWRRTDSIDMEKIQKSCMPHVVRRRLVEYFNGVLLHLAPVPGHPYNAGIIHNYNIQLSMAELDMYWSPFIHSAFQNEESAIHRLLTWVLSDFDLSSPSDETRRLTATILAWLLTSSNITLRDTATLGLVRLLSGYPDAMTRLLQQFEKVNDVYVRERLFAIALGVVTNSGEHSDIVQLTQCVYDQVFKDGVPPAHILLRDYARSVVEYALYLELPIEVDAERIRPPYGSSLPLPYPTKRDIARYKIPQHGRKYKKDPKRFSAQRDIEYSVLGMEGFNYDVIEKLVRNFNPIQIPFSKEYKDFKNSLSQSQQASFYELEELSKNLQKENREWINDRQFIQSKRGSQQQFDSFIAEFEKGLLSEQTESYRNIVIPHLQALSIANGQPNRKPFDYQPIARWIFRRVFELGWNVDRHGKFDENSSYRNRSGEFSAERTSRKYSWIALHEILARLTDNHCVSDWDDEIQPFQGSWNPFVRNIDPTFPVLATSIPFSNHSEKSNWWVPPDYQNWELDNWVNRIDDLPNPLHLAELQDNEGRRWINLVRSPEWKKEIEFGIHEWDGSSCRIWYHLRTYLIKLKDVERAFEWLSKQHFKDTRMPDLQRNYALFDKEFYWSPAYRHFKNEETDVWETVGNPWRRFRNSTFDGIVPTEIYDSGGGDYKIQRSNVYKPCQYLWEQLKLKNGKNPGECANENGELVCFDPSVGTDANGCFLIRKDFLMDFLQKNQLALCWTLLGEKQVRTKSMAAREFSITEFSGAYRLKPEDGGIEGGLRIVKEG